MITDIQVIPFINFIEDNDYFRNNINLTSDEYVDSIKFEECNNNKYVILTIKSNINHNIDNNINLNNTKSNVVSNTQPKNEIHDMATSNQIRYAFSLAKQTGDNYTKDALSKMSKVGIGALINELKKKKERLDKEVGTKATKKQLSFIQDYFDATGEVPPFDINNLSQDEAVKFINKISV